ncbi:BZ3500_MvSof-1268-A1-R1_Chr12-1g03644 [Microbotryum saponariae]|uniref:BZ3500_MvSof-1268-A1-R1_Chr12-1g03644 protein n=1 Tax=Microbotryum saponariae TaxID=289078 RepID=A0A2X0KP98_9BASI|nr:BZ3500_MvSof-1268-A1-R1_Chr12-1g03644 [Microbotryum saponariae]SDA05237.1 BZ3501_MvSof-1269-A2-R1_Chr12-1g03221 [Microbotryum saponariae]
MTTRLAIAQCLPTEIIEHIALYAAPWRVNPPYAEYIYAQHSPETIKNASMTCRSWRAGFGRMRCHTVFLNDNPFTQADAHDFVRWHQQVRPYPVRVLISRSFRCFDSLEESLGIVLRCVGTTLRSLVLSADPLPRLSADTQSDDDNASAPSLSALRPAPPFLTSELEDLILHGSTKGYDWDGLRAVELPSVRRLVVRSCYCASIDQFLEHFELPGLEDLTMVLDEPPSWEEKEYEVGNVIPLLEQLFTGSKPGIRRAKFELLWDPWNPHSAWTVQLARTIRLCTSTLRDLDLEITSHESWHREDDPAWPDDLDQVLDNLGPDSPLERLRIALPVCNISTWQRFITLIEDKLDNCQALRRLAFLLVHQSVGGTIRNIRTTPEVWHLGPGEHVPDCRSKGARVSPKKVGMLEGDRWDRVREQCRERGIKFVLRSSIDY